MGNYEKKKESEMTRGRNPLCPDDHLWTTRDEQSAESEVSEFMFGLIRLIKPRLVVETGSYLGDTTVAIADALKQNGFGELISCDIDPALVKQVNERLKKEGLFKFAEVFCESGIETIQRMGGHIDFAFIDSGGGMGVRKEEIKALIPLLRPLKMFAMHDTAPQHAHMSKVAQVVDLPKVYFNCPRGLTLFMKN